MAQNMRLFQEGQTALQSGRYEDAARCFESCLRENPEDSVALHSLGLVAFHLGQFAQAIDLITRALELKSDFSEAYNSLGVILRKLGRLQDSESYCLRALEVQPAYPEAFYNLGNARLDQGRFQEGLESFCAALKIRPDYARAWNSKAVCLHQLGQFTLAQKSYRESLRLDACNSQTWNNLGNLLREQGDLIAGQQAYWSGIQANPRNTELLYHLATAGGSQNQDKLLSLGLELFDLPDLSSEERIPLCFALGKMHENLEDHSEAFEFYAKGNQMQRAQISYEVSQTQDLFAKIPSIFSTRLVKELSSARVQTQLPVFILGMPRSGTTLVEQILASHSQVYGGGELELLKKSTLESGFWPKGQVYPNGIDELGGDTLGKMEALYLRLLPKVAHSCSVVTDKMPQNFILLGMIPLLFKDFRIIHCRRDAMDTCYSCFRQFFDQEQPYSYDLEELGIYYRSYQDLMCHWQQVLPGKILDLHYEDLVQDQDKLTRSLLNWCDLSFEASCLRFFEQERVASFAWEDSRPSL
jgi:Flp pilus assembly protein TadD